MLQRDCSVLGAPPLKTWAPHFIMALSLACTAARLWPATHDEEVVVDEPAWLSSGLVTAGLYARWAGPSAWQGAFEGLGDWGHKNPPLGKLLIGLSAAPFVEPQDTLDYHWNWSLSASQNAAEGHIPPLRLLRPARILTLSTGLVCLALLYAVVLQLTGSGWFGLLPVLVLARLSTFEFLAVRVHTDLTMLACSLAALSLLLRAVRGVQVGFPVFMLVLCGVFAGFACATKFSAGATAVGLLAGAAVTASSLRNGMIRAGLVAIIMAATFVAVNPYLYPDPIGRTLALQQNWKRSKLAQAGDPRIAPSAVTDRVTALRLTSRRGLARPFERPAVSARPFASFAAILVRAAMLAGLAALLALPLGARVRLRTPARAVLLGLGLALAGLAFEVATSSGPWGLFSLALIGLLGVASESRARDSQGRAAAAFGTVYGATFLVTTAWLPMDWGRYYMPIAALTAVCWGLGLRTMLATLRLSCGPSRLRAPALRALWFAAACGLFAQAWVMVLIAA